MYLIGGAEATGKANDTAAVYTPAFHQYNEEGKRQVYVWNVTLPEGFFSRAPLQQDPGELSEASCEAPSEAVLYFQPCSCGRTDLVLSELFAKCHKTRTCRDLLMHYSDHSLWHHIVYVW